MKSRKRKRKTRTSAAVNRRDVVYTYVPIDDVKSFAVMSARCVKCDKITMHACIECHKPFCENHLIDGRCNDCQGKRPSYLG